MASLRQSFLDAATDDRMRTLGEKLYAAALAGDWQAAKLFLLYVIGRPADAVNPDRVDLDEWRILDGSPTIVQLYRALLDSVPPDQAAEMLERQRPEDTDAMWENVCDKKDDTSRLHHLLAERDARVGK